MKRASVLILIFAVSIAAQQTLRPLPSPDPDRATVYIYKTRHSRTLGRLTFPVYWNEKRIAKLDGERYFMMRIQPGTHTFRSRNRRQGGVVLEAEAGKVYFLRLETEEDFMIHSPSLSLVPAEQGSYDVRQMKPIEQGDIVDREAVIIPPDLRQRN